MSVPTERATPDSQPSTAIVRAVAEAEDVSALDLPPLYETVDPESLDAMFESLSSSSASVSIEYAGYDVFVTTTPDGSFSVDIRD